MHSLLGQVAGAGWLLLAPPDHSALPVLATERSALPLVLAQLLGQPCQQPLAVAHVARSKQVVVIELHEKRA